MKTIEEGLGRIMFVAGALEHERPFLLGPLYIFLTLHPRNAVRCVPAYLAFFLEFLSRSVARERHYDCREFLKKPRVALRVDAQASATRTGIGGWLPYLGKNGEVDRCRSPWFSLEIKRETRPWTFERGDKPALLISTLEALAVLMALKLYHGDEPGSNATSVTLAPTFTDIRGNNTVLNRVMSTKFPSSALLMAFSMFLKKSKIRALVEWAPQESNKEADEVANGVTGGFFLGA